LMAALAEEMQRKAQQMNPQNLANSAWAFAKLGITNKPLMAALAKEMQRKAQQMNPQELANSAWAFLRLRISAPALMTQLGAAIVHLQPKGRIGHFNRAVILLASTRSGNFDEDLLGTVTSELFREGALSQATSYTVAASWWALRAAEGAERHRGVVEALEAECRRRGIKWEDVDSDLLLERSDGEEVLDEGEEQLELSDGASDGGGAGADTGALWKSLKDHIAGAVRPSSPAQDEESGTSSEEEDEESEQHDRSAVAKLTLELLEARRIAEVAMETTEAKKSRQRRNRRSYVDKRCGVFYTIAKMDEEFAAQERGPRYLNNVAVQEKKKGERGSEAARAEAPPPPPAPRPGGEGDEPGLS